MGFYCVFFSLFVKIYLAIKLLFYFELKNLFCFWVEFKNFRYIIIYVSQRGASDSVANFSALSNPADAQNLCMIWAGYFQSFVVSIYTVNKNK